MRFKGEALFLRGGHVHDSCKFVISIYHCIAGKGRKK